jgi:hypothetical protein
VAAARLFLGEAIAAVIDSASNATIGNFVMAFPFLERNG